MKFARINPLSGNVASTATAMQPSDVSVIAARAESFGPVVAKQGIDSFTETRWIPIETQPGHFPI